MSKQCDNTGVLAGSDWCLYCVVHGCEGYKEAKNMQRILGDKKAILATSSRRRKALKVNSYCLDCEDRHPGCHGTCERYKEFRQRMPRRCPVCLAATGCCDERCGNCGRKLPWEPWKEEE